MEEKLQALVDKWIEIAKEIDVDKDYTGSSDEYAEIQAEVNCLFSCAHSLQLIIGED